jgi:flagellar hook-associated protein 1 FlgK
MGMFGAFSAAAASMRLLPTGTPPAPDAALRPGSAAATGTALPPSVAVATAANADPAAIAGAAGTAVPMLARTLQPQLGEVTARLAGASVREQALGALAALFSPDGAEAALADCFEAFGQSWQSLTANPTGSAEQEAVAVRGQAFAAEVRRLAGGAEALDQSLRSELAGGLDQLNQALAGIHQEHRAIVSQAALGRSSQEAEQRRDELVDQVVELTGARVFPRENRLVALYSPSGQVLLEQRPQAFASAETGVPPGPGTVVAEGRITEGRLGALLTMVKDGSRQHPPTQPDPNPAAEVVRKLRSHLDAVVQTVTGRTRANQPVSFADAYDSAPVTDAGELRFGLFVGDRQSLELNPHLLDGSRTLKPAAAGPGLKALAASGRQFVADGLALSGTGYGGLVGTVTEGWARTAQAAGADAAVAATAHDLIQAKSRQGVNFDLQAEVMTLHGLQTSAGVTGQIGRAMGDLLEALDRVA